MPKIEQWLFAFIFAAATFFFLKISQHFLLKKIHLVKKSENKFNEILFIAFAETKTYFLFSLSCYLATLFLTNEKNYAKFIDKFFVLIFCSQLIIWSNKVISHLVTVYSNSARESDAGRATTVSAIGFIGKIITWLTVSLLALNNLGVNISALIAGLGISGIAVALAVQNILGDLLASLSIILDKPFAIGDQISVGTDTGTVMHIGLKTTRLRSITGEELIFSNSELLKSRIKNLKRMQERKITFNLGISYNTTTTKLEKIPLQIQEIIENEKHVRFERCYLANLSDSSIIFEVSYFVISQDFQIYASAHQNIHLNILKKLEEEKIKIPFPTRTLQMEKNDLL